MSVGTRRTRPRSRRSSRRSRWAELPPVRRRHEVCMSSASPAEVQAAAGDQDSLAAVVRARWEALKGGDVGSLPVIVGIVAITIFFTAKTSIFFTAVNFTNLIGQMAAVTVIAVGIVFVLLIGEIDLSVGYVSGVASVAVAEFQLAASSHNYPGL